MANGHVYAAFPFVPVNPGLSERPRHIQSLFEFWPPALFYAPVVAYWIWLGTNDWALSDVLNAMKTAAGK